MPIDFPSPPLTVGQQYQYNGTTWQWNGSAWIVVGTYPPVGGYVTTFNGLTGAVTGVTVGGTNVFTALNTFNAGISASGGTFANNFSTLGSFNVLNGGTFGSGTTFISIINKPSSAYGSGNGGGIWVRDGAIQIGGGSFQSGQGFWSVNPDSELMFFSGRQEMYINQGYQAAQNAISIAIGLNHTGNAIRIAKQSTTGSIDATKLIAGCDSNGIWYGLGFSGGTGGATFSGNVAMASTSSHTGLASFAGGLSASGMVVLAQGVCGGYGNDVQSYGYTSGYDIIPTNWQSISANISASPDINSIYLAPINISKKSIIKSIATQRGTDTTGNTGNFYFGLYNSNLYGLPNTLVYSSPSTVLGTGNFGVNRVSNVNYTANPGAYWIGIVFSAAGLSAGLARYGGVSSKLVSPISSSPVAQTTVTGLTAATSGFTLPTNLNNVSVTNVIGNNFPAVFFTAEGAT